MYRNSTVRELLRAIRVDHREQIERRDEMIQSLLDRIQHPERTPIWREAPPAPLDPADGWPSPWAFVPDPEQLP